MASHSHHHPNYSWPGMPLEETAMQQQQGPMHYVQQVQQPDQMLMGGEGYGMPASQLHAQRPFQFQQPMQPPQQPQFHGQMWVQPQLQEQMQLHVQEQMSPQLQAQMNLQRFQQQVFWEEQMQEVQKVHDFKHHPLPLARIKKIMKLGTPDVHMVALEAPVLFAKACQIFISDLTQRSWSHTIQNRKRTLQTSHITDATIEADMFDFLQDIVQRGEPQERENEIDVNLIVDPSNSDVHAV